MATWDDVDRLAGRFPEVTERPARMWRVRDKAFVYARPLRPADVSSLGGRAPEATPLGAYVADLGEKEALLAAEPDVYFTTPHFDGWPVVLVRLDRLGVEALGELVADAWLARAPRRLAAEWLAAQGDVPRP